MTVHSAIYTFISSFIALFPVINPIGSGFIVNDFLEALNAAQRKVVIKKIIINSLFIAIGTLLMGHLILLIFNLEIPIIQVAGGMLICKTGLGWLSDKETTNPEVSYETTNKISIKNIESKIFYPISFPIVMGAGSISVIFTLMASMSDKNSLLNTVINYIIIILAIVSICVILYFVLSQGPKIANKLGASGNMIINKLVAFFTFCIGLQILVIGISEIFHINVL
ncbi:MAG: hypothetical protein FWD70_04135 [Desulfuromonadales bacterium]|nr:hypothetical protein [Desulfuromonadales bacterium]